MPNAVWAHGEFLGDPYAGVVQIRTREGYTGQNCAECPAGRMCRGAWDYLCDRTIGMGIEAQIAALTQPLACGLVLITAAELRRSPTRRRKVDRKPPRKIWARLMTAMAAARERRQNEIERR